MYTSDVFNPSNISFSNNTDLSLIYRSIELDLSGEVCSIFALD
jgi:hypothetical protein